MRSFHLPEHGCCWLHLLCPGLVAYRFYPYAYDCSSVGCYVAANYSKWVGEKILLDFGGKTGALSSEGFSREMEVRLLQLFEVRNAGSTNIGSLPQITRDLQQTELAF